METVTSIDLRVIMDHGFILERAVCGRTVTFRARRAGAEPLSASGPNDLLAVAALRARVERLVAGRAA